MPHRLKHFLLTLAAIVFLVEAWLWDKTIALGHWLIGLVPWQAFKEAVARSIESLPPYGALPLFLIPVAVIEPLKVLALREIALGRFFLGALVFVVLKFVGVGLIAFIFDLTRDKLLSIGWFARFYDWVIYWRDKAHAFIEPYKAVARARIVQIEDAARRRLLELKRSLNLPAGQGRFWAALTRVRARVRRIQD